MFNRSHVARSAMKPGRRFAPEPAKTLTFLARARWSPVSSWPAFRRCFLGRFDRKKACKASAVVQASAALFFALPSYGQPAAIESSEVIQDPELSHAPTENQ